MNSTSNKKNTGEDSEATTKFIRPEPQGKNIKATLSKHYDNYKVLTFSDLFCILNRKIL